MKLLVGLGNPGEEYLNNRHNVGFMFLDFFLKQLPNESSAFTYDKYLQAHICSVNYSDKKIILVKPQTFMNKSGVAVAAVAKRYEADTPQDIIIVHDDLDIPLGKFKIQIGNGPKLHNGITSVEQHLKNKDFLRIRIGVDNRSSAISGETYVLQDFNTGERETLAETFSLIKKRLDIEKLI